MRKMKSKREKEERENLVRKMKSKREKEERENLIRKMKSKRERKRRDKGRSVCFDRVFWVF